MKKKSKLYGKLLFDMFLLLFLALMYQKRVISLHFHETGGLVLLGLFMLHKALNWQWIRSITAAIFRRKVKISAIWITDAMLLLSMIGVLVTGLLIAKTLPTAVPNARWIRPWHFFSSALALALSGIHLGLHARLIRNTLWNKIRLPGHIRKALGALLLCIIFGFGTYSLIDTDFFSWLGQPIFDLSVPAENEPPSAVEKGREEGKMSGRGNRDGKGNGGGKGLGLGKGSTQAEAHTGSPVSVIHTAASYSAILLWFAVVTAALDATIRKSRKNQPLPS